MTVDNRDIPHATAHAFAAPGQFAYSKHANAVVYVLSHSEGRDELATRSPENSRGTSGPPASSHSRAGGPQQEIRLLDLERFTDRRLSPGGSASTNPRVSADGRSVAYVTDRYGDDALVVQSLDEDEEPRPVVIAEHGIDDLWWSPSGAEIAYVAGVTTPGPDQPEGVQVIRRLDYKQDGRGVITHRSQLHVVDVATGRTRQLTAEEFDVVGPRWSPAGDVIAVTVFSNDGWSTQVGLVDAHTGALTRLGKPESYVEFAVWSPHGDQLLLVAEEEQTRTGPYWDCFLYRPATGAHTRLTEDVDYVIEAEPAWLDNESVILPVAHRATSKLLRLSMRDGATSELCAAEGLSTGFALAGERVVRSIESHSRAPEIALFDLENGGVSVITDQNGEAQALLPRTTLEHFTLARAGEEIDAWLLAPEALEPGHRYPIVMCVHGGPHGYYCDAFDVGHQALATSGFLVVYCNFRGSTTYGKAFTAAVNRDPLGEPFQDMLAVLDAVGERPYADATRAAIRGVSYGGYVAAWAVATTKRFRAAICASAETNLESFVGTSDLGFIDYLDWGPVEENREWFKRNSVTTFAHQATTPTLILCGENDQRCPIGQSEELFVALKRAGCETEFVRYAGGTHAFARRPIYREDLLRRSISWLKHHLGEPEQTV